MKERVPMRTCTPTELENFPQLDWPDIAPLMQERARDAIERVLETQDGAALSREQSLLLANVEGVDLTGMALRDYLQMLRDNGLGTLPGTAAEILDDEVRHVLSRNKLSTAQWREVIRTAHSCGIRSTSTLMYGHVEAPEHWVNQLMLLREIQNETGGFTEFVPLGFVHQNTLLFHQGLARSGPTLAEHLKIHALARLMLAGSINNIQVSWVQLDRRHSQLCLHAGANDDGGTQMAENI